MSDVYDLVIIGGGPAGLAAGCEGVKAGLKTSIIERNPQIGPPVNCAEGVTYRSLHRIFEPKPDWVLTHPKIGRIVAPGGQMVDVFDPDGGYVLDRERMETDLAGQFVQGGGVLRLNCRGVELFDADDHFSELLFENERGEKERIAARVFIAADGVESTIARAAGLENYLSLETTDAYIQYRLKLPEVDTTRIDVHLGLEVAPGAYGWVFPRSKTEANVGIGILGSITDGNRGEEFLDRFVKSRFDQYEIVGRSCGTSPRYEGTDNLALMNLLIAGDAARLVDSLTGGGICSALHSGIMAVQTADEFLSGRLKTVDDMGREYQWRIKDQYGSELNRLLTIKKFFAKLNDREINDLVETVELSLEHRGTDDLDLLGWVIRLIRTKPRLLSLARHLF